MVGFQINHTKMESTKLGGVIVDDEALKSEPISEIDSDSEQLPFDDAFQGSKPAVMKSINLH